MAENAYFDDGHVRITITQAIFGSKTYALSGITSTDVVEIPPNRGIPILLLITGGVIGCCGCCGLPSIKREDGTISGSICFFLVFAAILSLIIIGFSYRWIKRLKAEYVVLICTAAREVQAYVTYNPRKADDIAAAINKAISDRG